MSATLLDDVVALAHSDEMAHPGSLDDTVARCQTLESALLPIEARYGTSIRATRCQAKVRIAGHAWRRLSLDPLRWRDARGRPRLVLFPVDSDGIVTFASRQYSRGRLFPSVPDPLRDCYADILDYVASSMMRWIRSNREIGCLGLLVLGVLIGILVGVATQSVPVGSIVGLLVFLMTCTASSALINTEQERKWSTTFTGLLPHHARESVKQAELQGMCVYILAEPLSWNESISAVYTDPLIVGYQHGQLWLIDRFDTTTVEHLVAEEYVNA